MTKPIIGAPKPRWFHRPSAPMLMTAKTSSTRLATMSTVAATMNSAHPGPMAPKTSATWPHAVAASAPMARAETKAHATIPATTAAVTASPTRRA